LCGSGFGDNAGGFADPGTPELWRNQFREMLRRWGTVALILEPMDEYVPALPAARIADATDDASMAELSQGVRG